LTATVGGKVTPSGIRVGHCGLFYAGLLGFLRALPGALAQGG
jgi:hypothetical protein